ncbi:MAG: hypothetical protein LQ345_006139 [Seirophora villosa]|nr:MAG: hypothetical protein LQ345_006139 [Seirophora villosa]
MANRVQQDAFMDDSDDSCPLCVEEFDLSDKNFRPCPCGYQVCQFCYNNIKNNMNGLCPACRRPYDEKDIEWKSTSLEEQKADIALQARKKAMARQKESERKQVESLNRKHLAGLRVVQKNLVYVVGLNPKSREEDLLQTLRGDQYFGQYGKIVKIVVSKAKENANGNSSIGVYVTFARKQDAASCIAAVDGSQNGDRTLRAQYGTTKYCSAYLRNETCNNRNCMFLHEQGEDHDSFSRQDLSSINAVSTQRPAAQSSSSTSAPKQSQQAPQPQPPAQQAPQVVTAASHSMARQGSRDEPMSRSDSGDGSALPSSASWAAKNAQGESRRSSKPSSTSAPSPQVANADTVTSQLPSSQPPAAAVPEQQSQPLDHQTPSTTHSPSQPSFQQEDDPIQRLINVVNNSSYKFTFDRSIYSPEALQEIDAFPQLFDVNGGLVRFRMEKEREKERARQEDEARQNESRSLESLAMTEEDENPASGSLQLGGEPEDDGRQSAGGRQSSEPRSAIQPPFMATATGLPFGSSFFGNNQMINGRSLTPQQQQQLLLLRATNHQSPVNPPAQQGFTGQTSQHHHQPSNPFQNQGQSFSIPGHTRQASRFTFANDTSSASTAVKPSTNPQLMAQQSAMMPSSQNKNFQHQAMQPPNMHKTHFYSGIQGPPPGLKSSGTPPISGGGMFGQGHGFTQPVGGPGGLNGLGPTKNTNEQLMQNLLRGRGDTLNGLGPDVGKREFEFPSSQNPTTSHAPASALLNSLYGSQLGAYNGYQDHSLQKQKKKGKKHRHANTSSSGGGGIVDLADPSILQARMHHGGAGQGQFGLQGQENPIITPINPPTAASISMPRTHSPKFTKILPPSSPRSRKPTPIPATVPPGLSLPQDFPPLVAPSVPAAAPPKSLKKVNASNAPNALSASGSVIKPVVPVVPSQATKSTDAAVGKDTHGDPTTTKEDLPAKPTASVVEAVPKPKSRKETAIVGSVAPPRSRKTARSSDLASVNSGRGHKASPDTSKQTTEPITGDSNKRRPGNSNPEATKSGVDTGMKPLDTSQSSAKTQEDTPASTTTVSTISLPETPVTAVTQASGTSVGRSGQARTIRVLPTSKQEETKKGSTAAAQKDPNASATGSFPSRRGSLSSVHPPGTPASERISDNVSMTSTSMSRANSPPPSKVGTAPVRNVTKAQQRKERQAKAKQAEEAAKVEESPTKVVAGEPVQAPIIGRKKKQKKTASRGTADSTPAVTRPTSPQPHDEGILEQEEPAPSTPVKDSKKAEARAAAESEADTPISPAGQSINDQQQKNVLNAGALFSALQRSGEIASSAADIFKPVLGLNHRFDIDAQSLEHPGFGVPPTLTDAQNRQIDQGEPLCIDQGNHKRIIVLPDRRTLRGLSPEQANRYLELRTQALSTSNQLYHAGHGPAPPKQTRASSSASNVTFLPNPFLTEADQSQSAFTATASHLPQAFGSVGAANPTTYVDESAAIIATRRERLGVGVSVDDSEQAWMAGRRETEALEKRLNKLLMRNRRMVFGGNG